MGNILPISLKLNFTPNTLGCFGLRTVKGYCLKSGTAGKHFFSLKKKLPDKNALQNKNELFSPKTQGIFFCH